MNVNILIAMLRIQRYPFKFLHLRKTTLFQMGVFVCNMCLNMIKRKC